ncbi:MAG: formate dehydrogenase accessory sulfurtransferase FdhD [Deltaproteobacteria bacterium]|nr:MAG: formate dehydrogenase accessory sulfurtransferase FdhD [Deltaproteobacteria bacterium]
MDNTERLPIQRVTKEGKKDTEDLVTRELPLTIILNNQELVTLLCSPTDLKYLAIGFLSSEGLVKSKDEIEKIIVDDQRGVVRVKTEEDKEFANELIFKRFITSGCGRGASFYSAVDVQGQAKIESQIVISALEVFSLAKEFQRCSQIYRATGGVHSAALCDTTNILVFAEDIGRHNAIDKIFGQCLLEDIPTGEHLIITSGRITSEILLKVAKRNIPLIISKSAPTDLGVRLANDLGITLIGFVRGKRMNAYTNDWRIVTDGR